MEMDRRTALKSLGGLVVLAAGGCASKRTGTPWMPNHMTTEKGGVRAAKNPEFKKYKLARVKISGEQWIFRDDSMGGERDFSVTNYLGGATLDYHAASGNGRVGYNHTFRFERVPCPDGRGARDLQAIFLNTNTPINLQIVDGDPNFVNVVEVDTGLGFSVQALDIKNQIHYVTHALKGQECFYGMPNFMITPKVGNKENPDWENDTVFKLDTLTRKPLLVNPSESFYRGISNGGSGDCYCACSSGCTEAPANLRSSSGVKPTIITRSGQIIPISPEGRDTRLVKPGETIFGLWKENPRNFSTWQEYATKLREIEENAFCGPQKDQLCAGMTYIIPHKE
jgi:hypothetical protein